MKAVIDAIDGELGGLDEEIAAIEEQLDSKRERKNKLEALKSEAASLNGDGGGMATAEAPPKSRAKPKARSSRPRPVAADDRGDQVLAALRKLGPRVAKGAIQQETGLSGGTLNRTLIDLRESGKVTREGQRAGTRYSVAGDERAAKTAPAPAPPRQRQPSQSSKQECSKCGERLRKPDPSGLCGFCLEETGLQNGGGEAEAPDRGAD